MKWDRIGLDTAIEREKRAERNDISRAYRIARKLYPETPNDELYSTSRTNINAMRNRAKMHPKVSVIHWVEDTPYSLAVQFNEWMAKKNAK